MPFWWKAESCFVVASVTLKPVSPYFSGRPFSAAS